MRIIRRAAVPFMAAIIGAGVGGVALGSIPGPDGTISGCYSKATGALRVINAPTQTCSKSQTPISWNQTGPQGPPGPSNDSSTYMNLPQAVGASPTNFMSLDGLGELVARCEASYLPDPNEINTNVLFSNTTNDMLTLLGGPDTTGTVDPGELAGGWGANIVPNGSALSEGSTDNFSVYDPTTQQLVRITLSTVVNVTGDCEFVGSLQTSTAQPAS